MFYGIAAVENLLIFGADVTNAFGDAPPPKQGFFFHTDRALRDRWEMHNKRPRIRHGYVIPILVAMQGHSEA